MCVPLSKYHSVAIVVLHKVKTGIAELLMVQILLGHTSEEMCARERREISQGKR